MLGIYVDSRTWASHKWFLHGTIKGLLKQVFVERNHGTLVWRASSEHTFVGHTSTERTWTHLGTLLDVGH